MADKIGIIGYGNMGSAIGTQLKTKYPVIVFDKDKVLTKGIEGVKTASDIAALAEESDVLILAVKPQDFDGVLKAIKKYALKKLVISIAAGITTVHINKILGNARLVRAMPNMGAKIAESVTCLAKGGSATEEDLILAQELFYCFGVVKTIDEAMMDAATAISGSGPAYIFDFIATGALSLEDISEHTRHDFMKRLERAALGLGFNLEEASFLAANTVTTSINLLKKTRLPAAELVKQVASKGGTTEAALIVLHKGGSWEEAAQAAKKRADELAKGR